MSDSDIPARLLQRREEVKNLGSKLGAYFMGNFGALA
jgi:hypothetical protein